jgi:outer membrane protein assembly factor BamB
MRISAATTLFASCISLAFAQTPEALASVDRDAAAGFLTWSGWGGNIFNNRWALNSQASSKSVGKIEEHCRITYPVGVSAVPTLKEDIAYYPTWSGVFVALNYKTCVVKWQINVTDIIYKYAPVTQLQTTFIAPVARTSPQIDDKAGVIYFGTLTHSLLIAADLKNGQILGKIKTHPHELAILTQSPTLYQGKLILGTSSMEVSAASIPTYPCCSFVGTIAAFTFDKRSKQFSVAWNRTTLPEPYGPSGWSGASVWGSSAAIDPRRNQVVVATGNNYKAPASVVACLNATNNDMSCIPDGASLESVLALDINSGNINWRMRTNALDS